MSSRVIFPSVQYFHPNDSRLNSIESFLDYKYNVPYLSNTLLKVAEKLVFKTLAVSCLQPYVAMAAVYTDSPQRVALKTVGEKCAFYIKLTEFFFRKFSKYKL